VRRLEYIQIIGEIPMKYWDINCITCKLNIINPNYVIKTCPLRAQIEPIPGIMALRSLAGKLGSRLLRWSKASGDTLPPPVADLVLSLSLPFMTVLFTIHGLDPMWFLCDL
jgi:hypothetical protein